MSLPVRSATHTAVRASKYICPRCHIREQYGLITPTTRYNIRYSSTDVPAPPLLAKLKGDLKTAMRAKDTARLNVLRGVISDYNNASKTSQPIKTDVQLLSVLRKKRASSEAAIQEAKAANRNDIAEKQEQEMKVMDEYASSVALMSEDDLRKAIQTVVKKMKDAAAGSELKAGRVLGEVFKNLQGQTVDTQQVPKIVNELLSGSEGLQKDKDPQNSVPA